MTVLEKYQRLEAEGVWRPDTSAQRREVIVSIGEATLTLSSPSGQVLTHWSLPAIRRLEKSDTSVVFAPGRDAPETLEISDPAMIEALDKVLKAINRKSSGGGGLRRLMLFAGVIAALVLLAFWLPKAAARYVAAIAPPAAHAQIGARTFEQIEKLTGKACGASSGLIALEKLETRLFPEAQLKLVVLPSALAQTAHLPGGWILISHTIVEDHETPEVLAGFLLGEDLRRNTTEPLVIYLQRAGFKALLGLLTKATIPPEAIQQAAERTIAAAPVPIDMKTLAQNAVAAGFDPLPFGSAYDFSGETAQIMRETMEQAEYQIMPLLSDGDWIALQRICEE